MINKGNFQPHSNAHKTLAYLMQNNAPDVRLRQLLKYRKSKVDFENEVIAPLMKAAAIKAQANSIFVITTAGTELYMALQDEQPFFVDAPTRQIARKRETSVYSVYEANELKPYDGRPGAMDFIKLPSLMGSKLIYRKDAV